MDKQMFNELMSSVQEMDAIMKNQKKPGHVQKFRELEVKTIREMTGLSQSRFATLIGVSHRTLENWEQGHRHPTGPLDRPSSCLTSFPIRVYEPSFNGSNSKPSPGRHRTRQKHGTTGKRNREKAAEDE